MPETAVMDMPFDEGPPKPICPQRRRPPRRGSL